MLSAARHPPRVVFVRRTLADDAGTEAALKRLGLEILVSGSVSEGQGLLAAQPAGLVVTQLRDVGDSNAAVELLDFTARWRQIADTGGPQLLMLTAARAPEHLRTLFEQGRLTNFLALSDAGEVNARDLEATVRKVFHEDIFGLEHYLAQGFTREQLFLTKTGEKDLLVEAASDFASRSNAPSRVVTQFATAVDESFTNALYNAPEDAHGKPRFAQVSRTVPVSLDADKAIRVELACDGPRLAFSVTDSYGSLQPQVVCSYLARCFAQDGRQIEEKHGGAGLGLYMLFNATHHLVINIAPGKRTEVIGLLELSKSYKEFASRNKSFNLHVAPAAQGFK